MKTLRHDSALRRLRRNKWLIWVQLYCLLGWTLSAPTLNAVYVQDVNAPGFALNQPASYVPSWDGNGVGDPEPPEGADMSDNDTDGLPAWFEDWYGAVHGATVNMRGDPDCDHDGATDGNELHVMGTDPLNATSNGSGAPDGLWWQLTHTDTDGDGLMDWSESNGSGFGGQYGTDMHLSDTDGDGLSDGFEVNTSGTSPTNPDTDGNGLTDLEDRLIANDPGGDYDADGLTNAQEAQQTYPNEHWHWLRTSPGWADTDGDGLSDGYEVSSYRHGESKSSSNPLLISTDRNGVPDPQTLNYLFPSDRYGITGPGTLPNATGGVSYTSPAFTVANPQGATTWAVTAGNLPASFAFNGNSLVGSAPPGSYSFTVQVTDAGNRSATADYTLGVDLAALTITSAAVVPEVLFGATVSHSFSAAGGYGGVSWSVPYGGLPSGLNLSTDGQLSGAATYTGNYMFTVRVADMYGYTAEQTVSLNVTLPALVISSTALSTGVQAGSGLSASFTAAGGTGNYSWSVPSGSLPWGMSFSGDGQLSGTPYSTGSYWFTVRVTDGSGSYADQGAYVSVSDVPPPPPPEPPQITSNQYLPSGQDGSAYSFDFSASGGSGFYTWSSWWGLPSGLSLSSSGQLAGTVSGSGSYSFTVQVTDTSGNSASQTFYLYVDIAPPPAPPQINGPLTFEASIWTPQSWTLTASGGSGGSYAWSLWNSGLPSGFSLSADGTLTGNFEGQTGSLSFYAQVSDGSSFSGQWFTVNVTDRDVDGDGMLASMEHELALELGLPLHDGSRNSVQPGLDDWYVYYHARLAATDGTDEDGDGLGSLLEQVLGTNPALKDSDGDFRPDWWEHYQAYGRFFDTTDADGDGLHAVLEARMGTSDEQEDSDGDTLTDAYEWTYIQYSEPADADSDNDGLNDGAELTAGTQARSPDSDDDYLTDYEEVNNLYGLAVPTSALDADSDDDGTPDYGEVNLTDSDGGGIPDRLEEHWNMNIHDARDEADDYDGDGHSNYTAYLTGWDIHAQFVPQFDTDADGMTNLYELARGFDPADQKDGADDPDGDFLTNAEEYVAQTSPTHYLTPGYEGETVTDRDESTGAGVFDENGALVTHAVLSDYEVAFGQELFLNATPPLTRGNGPMEEDREYDDDWDQDRVSNFDELYPIYGDPTDPRVWQEPLEITTTSLASGQQGAPYSAVLAQVGGQPGFTYTLASGTLPDGLALDASVPGVWAISGTPTAAGSRTFTLRVADAYQRTDEQELTLVVAPSGPPLTVAFSGSGMVGQALTTGVSAMGGTPPYAFSIANLPPGLSLVGEQITGTPTTAGSYAVTATVVDSSEPPVTAAQTGTFTVEPSALTLTTTDAQLAGMVGQAYSVVLSAAGAVEPVSFSVNAGLPAGLSFDSGTGTISGTPTAETLDGPVAVTITVSSGGESQDFSRSIDISQPVVITSAAELPGVSKDSVYLQELNAVGGRGTLVFTKSAGTLPPGLTLSGTGYLTGTVSAGGTYVFTVQAADELGRFGAKEFTLVVSVPPPPLMFVTTTLPPAGVNSNYTGSVQATGVGTLTFTATGLPDWLQMSASGLFSGTPSSQAVGAYTFTVEVQDEVSEDTAANYRKVSATVALVVAAAGAGGGTNTVQARPVPRGRPTAVPYTVPDDDDPTLPGEPALPRPRPTPPSTPPGSGILFSAIRVKTLDYIGGQKLEHPTETTQTGGGVSWEKPGPEPKQPKYADDGFNGDADLEGNNADPGDPRDDVPLVPQTWVPATEGEEGAVQRSHGGSSFTQNTGPYEAPGNMQGTYSAKNAYTPPDKQEEELPGFDNAVARSVLGNMNYQRGDASHGWMGNGAMGVRGTSASASLISGTDIDAPVITYTDGNGQQRTSTVKYNTQDAYLRQSELRLQTNAAITSGQPPRSAVFTLTKTTEANDGGTASTTECLAQLKLAITSGKVSDTVEVLSGTLPPDVTVTGGVVSLRPPAAVEGKYIQYTLLPVEVKVNDTADAKDDMVRKEQKIGSTAWRQWIPCTVKIPESGPGKTITSIGVTAESGTMKFVQDSATPPTHTTEGAANVAVTLDAQGQGKFWITGITQSTTKGDAKLQIRKNGATGDVLATQPMTVFWFDSTIKAEASGNANDTAIALSADKKSYGIVLGNGMDITATASVVPTGLDHTVKQISDWQLGIMQNVTTTRTWRGKNTVNGVETKAKGVYQTTDRLDTLQPTPDIIMQISEIGGAQKFEATRPANSDTVDPPFMPADVQLQTHNGAWLKWYESDMQDTFTIWSGIIEVTNGNRGTVFIPIKQNDWKAHGNSSQQNQKASPSTGDGAQPTKVPSTQRPTAVDHIGDPNNTSWSVENN